MLEWLAATLTLCFPSLCGEEAGGKGHPVEWISNWFLLSRGEYSSVAGLKRGFWTRPSRGMTVSVWTECARRFDVLQSCPAHLKGRLRQAARLALDARHQAASVEDATKETRAGKYSVCCPGCCTHDEGRVGKAELIKRFDQFGDSGQRSTGCRKGCVFFQSPAHQKARAAGLRVGGVARARQCLTGAALAPGDETTFQDLRRMASAGSRDTFAPTVFDFERDISVDLEKHVRFWRSTRLHPEYFLTDREGVHTSI